MTKNNVINAPLPIAETKGGTSQTTYTTGDILYASATNVLSKLAIGTVGSNLQVASGVPAWFNVDSDIVIMEDFLASTANSPHQFRGANSSGSSGINNATSIQDKDHPGCVYGGTGSSSSGVGGWDANSSNGNGGIILGGGALSITWLIKIPILSTSAQRFTVDIGLLDASAANTPGNGVYFSYNDNVNSGNWTITALSASTPTTKNSSTAAGTGWTTLRIDINAAGNSIGFFVNGSEVANSPITTGIPTTGMGPAMRITKSVGTTQRFLHADYCKVFYQLTTPR